MARPAPRLGSLKPKLKAAEFRTVVPKAKQVDSELRTSAHERWRKIVLDRAGWRCQGEGCGRQGGRGGVRLFADHIVERKDGGAPLDPENGMALCGSCHTKKTAIERTRRLHERPAAAEEGNERAIEGRGDGAGPPAQREKVTRGARRSAGGFGGAV